MTPFKAVYGQDPPTLDGSTTNADLESRLIERDEMLEVMREHIHKAQQVMKKQAGGHRREVIFAVGDKV